MASMQQILFSISNSDQGTVFLKPFAQVISEAGAFGGFARASAELNLSAGGILTLSTSAAGDFTEQSGEDSYEWLTSGTSSLFSYRYRTTPTSVPGFFGPARNVWTPINNGVSFTILRDVGFLPNGGSEFASFALILELAKTSNTSEILASGQFNFNVSASTDGGIIQ